MNGLVFPYERWPAAGRAVALHVRRPSRGRRGVTQLGSNENASSGVDATRLSFTRSVTGGASPAPRLASLHPNTPGRPAALPERALPRCSYTAPPRAARRPRRRWQRRALVPLAPRMPHRPSHFFAALSLSGIFDDGFLHGGTLQDERGSTQVLADIAPKARGVRSSTISVCVDCARRSNSDAAAAARSFSRSTRFTTTQKERNAFRS
jgi:hypothetical protein